MHNIVLSQLIMICVTASEMLTRFLDTKQRDARATWGPSKGRLRVTTSHGIAAAALNDGVVGVF